jgi:hypothetical protein
MGDKVLALVKASRRTNSAAMKILQHVEGLIEDEQKKRMFHLFETDASFTEFYAFLVLQQCSSQVKI